MMRRGLLLICAMLWGSGCASTRLSDSPPTPSQGTREPVTIKVRRANTIVGAAVAYQVQDNGRTVGQLGKGGELVWQRDPGHLHLSIYQVSSAALYAALGPGGIIINAPRTEVDDLVPAGSTRSYFVGKPNFRNPDFKADQPIDQEAVGKVVAERRKTLLAGSAQPWSMDEKSFLHIHALLGLWPQLKAGMTYAEMAALWEPIDPRFAQKLTKLGATPPVARPVGYGYRIRDEEAARLCSDAGLMRAATRVPAALELLFSFDEQGHLTKWGPKP